MPKDDLEEKKESGLPGGGAGRRDEVGGSGVYPMSGPHPKSNAPIVTPASWGQGKRGAAGYEDHGESELIMTRVIPERCRDIMTKDPVFCHASDSASVAAKLMLKHDIGVLPVVGAFPEYKLIGILTDRDLAMRVVAPGYDPYKTTVQAIMSSPVITCSPDDDYQRALDLMEQHQVKRIPAIDNAEHVVGIISEADVALRIPDEKKIEEFVRSIAQPA